MSDADPKVPISKAARAVSARLLDRSEGLMDAGGPTATEAGATLAVAAAAWAIVSELARAREDRATVISGRREVL